MTIKSGLPTYLSRRALRWMTAVKKEFDFTDPEIEILISTAECLDQIQWARRRLRRFGQIYLNSQKNWAPRPELQVLKDSKNAFFQGVKLLRITGEDTDETTQAQTRYLRGKRS